MEVVTDKLLEEALALAAHGFSVVFLRGKRPASTHGYKDSTRDPEALIAIRRLYPDADNIGVVPGESGIVVVDLDLDKDPALAKALARLDAEIAVRGALPHTVEVLTGGGGTHLYYKARPGRPIGQLNGIYNPDEDRVEAGVDVRGTVGYVVAPPSIHPVTGVAYKWSDGGFLPEKLAEIPDWLLEFLDPPASRQIAKPPKWAPTENTSNRELLRAEGILRAACDRVSRLTPGGRRTEIQRVAYRVGGLSWTGLSEQRLVDEVFSAAHACGKGDRDTRRTIADAVRDGIASPTPLPPDDFDGGREPSRLNLKVRLRAWHVDAFQTPTGGQEGDLHETPVGEVIAELDLRPGPNGEPGSPFPTVLNVSSVLALDTRFRGRLAYDDFAGIPTIEGEALTDADLINLGVWMDSTYGIKAVPQVIHDGLMQAAYERRYHPVRDYLMALPKWDGTCRLDNWLHWWVGCQEDELSRVYGRKWAISCIARVMQPGCKVDTALILQGDEGLFKSTAFKVLAGQDWFQDSPIDLGKDHAVMFFSGVWIYESAELETTRRATAEKVKSFLTTTHDRFKAPYGRVYENRPRSFVMVGTTNDEVFLTLGATNRRFWVRQVTTKVDVSRLAVERDQFWAEALFRYTNSEEWHLTDEEAAMAKDDNEQWQHDDPWARQVLKWANRRVGGFTVDEVLIDALGMRIGDVGRVMESMRIAAILKSGGFKKKRRTKNGQRVSVWEK